MKTLVFRLVGAVTVVAGIVPIWLATFYGKMVRTTRIFETSIVRVNPQFHAADVQSHLYLATLATALFGGALAVGGLAMTLRKAWGLLVITTAIVLCAVWPWALKATGMSHYAFESGNWGETVVMLCLSCAALVGYFAARENRQ